MSKHTEWEARGLTIFRPGETALAIATVPPHHKDAREIARLIAAAPEMLAALRETFPLLEENLRWHRDMQSSPAMVEKAKRAVDAARAAIAKATGGEP